MGAADDEAKSLSGGPDGVQHVGRARAGSSRSLRSCRGNPEGLGHSDISHRSQGSPYIRLRAADALLAVTSDPDGLNTLERLAADRRTRLRALTLLSTKGDPQRTAMVARALLPKSAAGLSRMGEGHSYDPQYVLAAIHTLEVVQDQ